MKHACVEIPMRVAAYCLMPNHFHLVVWPEKDGEMSRWMHWLQNAFVRRYHEHYHSSGHIWQVRFKAFPIEQDDHLLTVVRYAQLLEEELVELEHFRRDYPSSEFWNSSRANAVHRANWVKTLSMPPKHDPGN
jgi:REP element-mobilizing transposase RayT